MAITEILQQWWHQQSWLEAIGFIFGIACVLLAALNSIWNWPLAIISVSAYVFIFFEAHLFADMGLQVYFLAMNIYGWYYWSRKPSGEAETKVSRLSKQNALLAIVGIAVFTVALGWGLKYTSASYPYLDSFCTACSLVAQVLLARKVLENWLIWIFVDVIYVGIYIFNDLHLTAIMYAIYILIAAIGYFDWRRDVVSDR